MGIISLFDCFRSILRDNGCLGMKDVKDIRARKYKEYKGAIYENLYSKEVKILKKLFYILICIAFLGFLSSCGGGDDEAVPEKTHTEEQTTDEQGPTTDVGEAEIKYQQSCSKCHGGDLVSGGAPDLNAIGTKYSKDELLGIIKNGKGNMPGGLLTGEDAEAVASWLTEKK